MKRIFLSHSVRDRKVASDIKRELERLGVTAFVLEDEAQSGADLRKEVKDAIRKSDSVVVLVTRPEGASGNWIGYEVGSASALGKDVVIMKPSSYSVGDLPSDLVGWRMLDFDPSTPRKTAQILVSSLAVAD